MSKKKKNTPQAKPTNKNSGIFFVLYLASMVVTFLSIFAIFNDTNNKIAGAIAIGGFILSLVFGTMYRSAFDSKRK